MYVHVVNPNTGHTSVYTQAELKREALAACKGKGKLTAYWVSVNPASSAVAVVVAQYVMADGWSATIETVI